MNYWERVAIAFTLIVASSIINLTAMHVFVDSHNVGALLGGVACTISLIAGKVWT